MLSKTSRLLLPASGLFFLAVSCLSLPVGRVNLNVNSVTETAPPELNDPSIPDTSAVLEHLAAAAEESIFITGLYFNPDCDPRLVKNIKNAARRGVKVKFIISDSQSSRKSLYRMDLDLLPNVETRFFNIGPYGRRPWGMVHAKYMIVDGKYAVLGSANFSRPALFNNREINAYISDPATVGRLTDIFQNDLLIAGFSTARTDTLFYKDSAKAVTFNTDATYQLVESAPWQFDNPEILDILDVLTNVIQRAQKSIKGEIYLYNSANTNSPYIEKNIFAALKRGIEVSLIANKNTFAETDDYGNYRYADYREALVRAATNGVRIRLIDTQKLFPDDFSTTHSKVLIVDDRFLIIQSANWTASSVYDNREVGVFTKDPAMLGQMLRIYERDWKFSEDFVKPGP